MYAAVMLHECANSYMTIRKLNLTKVYLNHPEIYNEYFFGLFENCLPKSWQAGEKKKKAKKLRLMV